MAESAPETRSDYDDGSAVAAAAATTTTAATTEEIPAQPATGAEEKALVGAAVKAHSGLREGDTWYLVGSRWWRRWCEYSGYESAQASFRVYYGTSSAASSSSAAAFGGSAGTRPGPIDNGELLEADRYAADAGAQALRTGLLEGADYELLPAQAWALLHAWYGGGPAAARRVVRTGAYSVNPFAVELKPLGVVAHRSGAPDVKKMARISKAATVGQMRTALCALLGVEADAVRLWDFHGNTRYKLLDDDTRTLEQAQIIEGNPILLEEKNADGSWPAQPSYGAVSVGTSSSSSSYGYSNSYGYSSYGSGSSYDSYGSSYYGGGSYYSTPMEAPGLCGLQNLGNTCFMNSALQCLSNTEPLVMYLLSGRWRRELNTTNPLGTRGELTTEYSALVRALWRGQSGVFSPRDFKWKLGRFAPQFEGYQQHDSQELLAFLLDGLHEDLNRVVNKPYVEIPDYAGQSDEQWAADSWQRHLLRNNSIIVDLFQAQLKSTVICPVCSHVSVTFDPFMYLSLPLPQDNSRHLNAVVRFASPSRLPLRVALDLNLPDSATIADLLKAICDKCPEDGRPDPSSLILTDVYSSRFYRQFKPSEPLSTVSDRDNLVAFEAPLLAETPDAVRVPVLLSKRERSTYYSYISDVLFSSPLVLSVPASVTYFGACAEILRRVSRFFDPEEIARIVENFIQEAETEAAETTTEAAAVAAGDGEMADEEQAPAEQPPAEKPATETDGGGVDIEMVEVVPQQHPVAGEEEAERPPVVTEPADDSYPSYSSSSSSVNSFDSEEDEAPPPGFVPPPSRPVPPPKRKLAVSADPSAAAATSAGGETEEDVFLPRIFPGIPNSRLLSAVDSLFKLEASDAYGKTPYSRSDELDIGDGNKPLNLKPTTFLVARFTDEAMRAYMVGVDGQFDPASIPAPAYSGYTSSYSAATQTRATLDECMELFMQAEQLGPDDLWHCPSCREFRQATKKFDIWSLPPVLVIHLKRFSYKNKYWRDKLDTIVDFPIEALDMTSRMLRPGQQGQQAIYDLFAVSNHYGSMGGGHYTAFAKNKDTDVWHKFDDSHVSTVSDPETSLKTSAAYMLFYRLRSFVTPEFQQEPDADAAAAGTSASATPSPAVNLTQAPAATSPPVHTLASLHAQHHTDSDDEDTNNGL